MASSGGCFLVDALSRLRRRIVEASSTHCRRLVDALSEARRRIVDFGGLLRPPRGLVEFAAVGAFDEGDDFARHGIEGEGDGGVLAGSEGERAGDCADVGDVAA